MNYTFNNKTIRIPDNDIKLYMKNNSLAEEQAIEMWLIDEGYMECEELEELETKGKEVMRTIHDARKNTVKRERKPKEDPEKAEIIAELAEFLDNILKIGDNVVENVVISNKTKIVEFDLGENHYKLDLIRQRTAKKE